jgi:hypothetical protein
MLTKTKAARLLWQSQISLAEFNSTSIPAAVQVPPAFAANKLLEFSRVLTANQMVVGCHSWHTSQYDKFFHVQLSASPDSSFIVSKPSSTVEIHKQSIGSAKSPSAYIFLCYGTTVNVVKEPSLLLCA